MKSYWIQIEVFDTWCLFLDIFNMPYVSQHLFSNVTHVIPYDVKVHRYLIHMMASSAYSTFLSKW